MTYAIKFSQNIIEVTRPECLPFPKRKNQLSSQNHSAYREFSDERTSSQPFYHSDNCCACLNSPCIQFSVTVMDSPAYSRTTERHGRWLRRVERREAVDQNQGQALALDVSLIGSCDWDEPDSPITLSSDSSSVVCLSPALPTAASLADPNPVYLRTE